MSHSAERRSAPLPDGGRLSYAILGDTDAHAGAPILLHRPLGGSMALWGEFARKLAAEFRVIAFDPRGVGRSSDAPWSHGTRAMAGDAVALLDTLGIPEAHVFGLSLGGMVASWMAIDFPTRLQKLVLASTLSEPAAISRRAFRRALGFARCFTRPGVHAEVCLVRQVLSAEFRAAHPGRVHDIEHIIRQTPAKPRNLWVLAVAAARHSVEPELRHLRIETLILDGGLDFIARRASQEELLRDLPNATLQVLPGAGHDMTLEQPAATAERVIRFLRGEKESGTPTA